ncbi:MAG: hypothetical protein IJX76_09485 [Clostridia bacterium]|nr:hypothetical protein [Clostridia bacterium]
MNNEEIKTPEVAPETTEAPVEAPVTEAPAEATPAAPAATPVRAPITDPRKYFMMSNIFRGITVLLMVVCVIMSLFMPVFSVNTLEDTTLDDYGLNLEALGLDEDDTAVNFSIMDIISDLGDEFQLCFTLDIKNPEDWEKIAEISEEPGMFTTAVDVTMMNLTDKDANSSPLADMVSSFYESRILTCIPYFLLLMPVIMIIGLAISTVIRLIQAIIGFIKPSSQIKKTDASACIVTTILIVACYIVHFFYSCFSLNIVNVVIMAVVSVGAVVMNIVYKKHTKEIVDAQFSL